jgi:hypothetical protein
MIPKRTPAGSRGINTQMANPKKARSVNAVTPRDKQTILQTFPTMKCLLHLHGLFKGE